MSGNLCEWCEDRYEKYTANPQTNPIGKIGYYYVVRDYGRTVWSRKPGEDVKNTGFRLAL